MPLAASPSPPCADITGRAWTGRTGPGDGVIQGHESVPPARTALPWAPHERRRLQPLIEGSVKAALATRQAPSPRNEHWSVPHWGWNRFGDGDGGRAGRGLRREGPEAPGHRGRRAEGGAASAGRPRPVPPSHPPPREHSGRRFPPRPCKDPQAGPAPGRPYRPRPTHPASPRPAPLRAAPSSQPARCACPTGNP